MGPVDDARFSIYVEADVRNQVNREISGWLRQTDNLARWREALVRLKRDVERTLCERQVELDEFGMRLEWAKDDRETFHTARLEFLSWRVRALSFKNGIEARLAEIKRRREDVMTAYETLIAQAAALIPTDTPDGAAWHQARSRFDAAGR